MGGYFLGMDLSSVATPLKEVMSLPSLAYQLSLGGSWTFLSSMTKCCQVQSCEDLYREQQPSWAHECNDHVMSRKVLPKHTSPSFCSSIFSIFSLVTFPKPWSTDTQSSTTIQSEHSSILSPQRFDQLLLLEINLMMAKSSANLWI